MAESTNPTIRMARGDEPTVQMIAGIPFLSVDGTYRVPQHSFLSLAELSRWSGSLALTVALLEAKVREEAGDDDAADAAVYGEEPAA